jgi:hypothetical protein
MGFSSKATQASEVSVDRQTANAGEFDRSNI